MSKSVTVQIDDREKRPILFPSTIQFKDKLLIVHTEKIRLKTGDYRLKGHPKDVIIERKGGQRELFSNLCTPAGTKRTAKAFGRLSEACHYPVLYIEVPLPELFRLRRNNQPVITNPEVIIERLARVIKRYNLNVFWLPRSKSSSSHIRRLHGTVLLHIMLANAASNSKGK